MPESSFSTGNQIASPEIAVGKPVTAVLLAKLKGRDVELMDLMSAFGGPASTGAGSAITYEGDVVISVSQNLSGLHYYNNLTINSGVVVTADKPLIIMARGTVNISGATITANGCGALGGELSYGNGVNGVVGTGGGGAGLVSAGGKGGDCVYFPVVAIIGGAGGAASSSGQTGEAIPAHLVGQILASALSTAPGGAGGGAGGGGSFGVGGRGGGVIVIIAPTVICTDGVITAAGLAGGDGTGGASGGGGGGGGIIYIKTKTYTAPATLTVNGGIGGIGGGSGQVGGNGSAGIKQVDIYA